MKFRNDNSTDVTEENSDLGKRANDEFLDAMLPESQMTDAPGHDCLYLYSASYANVDKLVTRFGNILSISEAEFDAERKIIWLSVKNSCGKEDDNVPFARYFRTGSRSETRDLTRNKTTSRKQHRMRLRDKPQLQYDLIN